MTDYTHLGRRVNPLIDDFLSFLSIEEQIINGEYYRLTIQEAVLRVHQWGLWDFVPPCLCIMAQALDENGATWPRKHLLSLFALKAKHREPDRMIRLASFGAPIPAEWRLA